MTLNDFILSNNTKYRISRHLAFWGVFFLITMLTDLRMNEQLTSRVIKHHILFFTLFIPMRIIMVYIFIYVLIPKFIYTKKYFLFLIASITTFIICFFVNLIPGYLFHFNYPYPPSTEAGMRFLFFLIDYDNIIFKGIFLIGVVVLVKLTKSWYLQQIENTRLAEQEAENRTKLFKSQMQPEFLFHSLDGLHKKIKNQSDEASEMVLCLADIFSYILYDCDTISILLKKELTAIQNLIAAENMNEEADTMINISIQGNSENKYIAPLTLFSFINGHINKSEGEKSIHIDISINETEVALVMRLKTFIDNLSETEEANNVNDNWAKDPSAHSIKYQIKNNGQANDYTIRAKVELMASTNPETINNHLIAVN